MASRVPLAEMTLHSTFSSCSEWQRQNASMDDLWLLACSCFFAGFAGASGLGLGVRKSVHIHELSGRTTLSLRRILEWWGFDRKHRWKS